MVFGALLGGLVNRAGERSYGELQRQRETEDFQRQHRIAFNVDFLNRHYDDLLPEQQEALHGNLAKDLNINPKDFQAYVGGARAIHKILPEMPAPVPFSDLPSSIYAQQPAQAISGPSTTPGEIKEQRKFDMNQRLIDQKIARIKGMGLPPQYERMASLQAQGVPIIPYETAGLRTEMQRDIAEMKSGEFKGGRSLVIRNGQPLPIRATGQDEFILDPQRGWVPYAPQEGDQVYEKPIPRGITTGAADVYGYNRDPRQPAAPEALGIGTPPARVSPPQSQLTTIEDATGPKVVEYQPGRGGEPGTIRTVQQGAAKGRLPNIPGSTKTQIEGLGMAAQTLGNLQQQIPQITSTGPVWGRLKNIQFQYLGGWGASPEEVQVAQNINQLMLQSFAVAGANFTTNEMNIFRQLYPRPEDTMETAMGKIPGMLKYVQDQMKIKQGLLTPGQKIGVTMPDVGTGGQPPKDMSGYGPRQQFRHNGEVKWGRRNLSTGKIMLEK